jgi:hypothetical protein
MVPIWQDNYCMVDEKQFEEALRGIILEICEVLYRNGYRTAHVGAIMRLIGVPEERARDHDEDYFELDDDFVNEIAQKRQWAKIKIPPGTSIH